MGGQTRVVLLQENHEPLSFITYTGAENYFFFSKNFAENNIQKGIDELVKEAIKYDSIKDTTLAPDGYGLTVIDFKNKTLHSLTDYDKPGFLGVSSYQLRLMGGYQSDQENEFKYLTQENKLLFINTQTGKKCNIDDFFGTRDTTKINIYLDSLSDRVKSKGEIKNDVSPRLYHYEVSPSNFDFTCHYYENPAQLFIDLHNAQFPFKVSDINEWLNFVENREDEESLKVIQTYLKAHSEKETLEASLANSTKNKTQKVKV